MKQITFDELRAECKQLRADLRDARQDANGYKARAEAAEAERDRLKAIAEVSDAGYRKLMEDANKFREENEALKVVLEEYHRQTIVSQGMFFGVHQSENIDCPICALLHSKGETMHSPTENMCGKPQRR